MKIYYCPHCNRVCKNGMVRVYLKKRVCRFWVFADAAADGGYCDYITDTSIWHVVDNVIKVTF